MLVKAWVIQIKNHSLNLISTKSTLSKARECNQTVERYVSMK